MIPSARPVAIGLRLYRALANAFPYEFQNAYGDELMQVTEDAIERIWRRHGILGLLRLLVDIALRIPVEYAAEFSADIRYGLRMLRASPGFTAVALISLTLGIGVATAAYSEMNGYVMRDVPAVRHPDELVLLKNPASFPDYQRYRERGDLFAGTLAYRAPVPFGISLGGRTERVWGHLVTSSYFSTLGVQAALGRVLNAGDDQPGRAPVVVVSNRFWRNHLGSDPSAVGKPLTINGQPCTVIGIGPEDFQGASPMIYGADVWLPLSVGASVAPELADNVLERRDLAVFQVVGRLRPGVSEARAQAALDAMKRQIEQEFSDPNRDLPGRRIGLAPGGKLMPVDKKDIPMFTSFFIVLGGMILLIASSNVANMMLARAVDRRKEIAVRLALGAGRARLVRQLLTESLLIAAAAGGLGFAWAAWLMHAASQLPMPYSVPLTLNLEPDGRVLLFTLALTACAGLAFGLVPALQATRPDLTTALKEGGNLRVRRFRRLSMRNLLMVGQMAVSLGLLLITGTLVVGHRRIANVETGFDPRNLYLISLDPVRDGYPAARTAEFFEKLLNRTRSLPAVSAAALASDTPMSMIGKPGVQFAYDGIRGKELNGAAQFAVGRDYFDTLGVPIVLGRGFRKEDETDGATAVIVSERLVKDCWQGRDPLGRRIEIGNENLPTFGFGGGGGSKRGARLPGKPRVFEVVGVARNLRIGLNFGVSNAPSIIYRPLQPADTLRPPWMGLTLMVRAVPGVDVLTPVRREISAMDDRVKPFNARSMPEQIDGLMFQVKVALWTYGCIGIFGLILASVGLAGVTAYSVTQRRREIGIRIALGAQRNDVLGLVMKEGAILILVGAAIGMAAGRGGLRLLAAVLSTIAQTAGTSMSDPALLVGAPLLLAALALIACYVPARKSLRIDPAVSLRQE
jgi:predicted permease